MTNNKFIKDRLLVQGGNITDLEARVQDQEEFLELLETQRLLDADIRQNEEGDIVRVFEAEK